MLLVSQERAAIKALPPPLIHSRPYGIVGWLLRLMHIRNLLQVPPRALYARQEKSISQEFLKIREKYHHDLYEG